ncbi:MAG: tellurite resistance TerB family protein [Balneola sp.]
MDILLGIAVIWGGIWLLGKIFSPNNNQLGSHSNQMGAFEVRLHDTKLGNEPNAPAAKEVQCKGIFPIHRAMNLEAIISVFDATEGELEPVFSLLEDFQEPENIVFQSRSKIGEVQPNYGFTDWVTLGGVIPEILQPPYSGDRNLRVLVRLIDLSNPPTIIYGFQQPNDTGTIWQGEVGFSWEFKEKGYKEAQENYEEAASIALKIGVAVAMADGSLHNKEGEILKNWIKKKIDFYGEEKRKDLKNKYNDDLRQAYLDSQNGSLLLSSLVNRLNEIGDKRSKYEAIELGYDIMAADGVADAKELEIIKNIASSLGLDIDEIDNLRDKKLVNLSTEMSSQASIENILNIDPNWSNEKVRKHLRGEFNKWNNRLNTLPEGEQRDNAQQMLDLISEARQKYA